LHVSKALAEQTVVPGAQPPVHAPPTHAWFVHAAGLPHAPVGPHVSTPLPAHWVAPGKHATHPPLRHNGVALEHDNGVPHCPAASQVSTPPGPESEPALEHFVSPGMHTPVQAPALHANAQDDALPHVPFAVHVCTPSALHWVAPGVHEAAHAPALQTWPQAGPLFCQVPEALQVCGCWPLHCISPGVHVPVQLPERHTYGQVVPVLSQLPLVSQA
jgi:hypothetical protein